MVFYDTIHVHMNDAASPSTTAESIDSRLLVEECDGL